VLEDYRRIIEDYRSIIEDNTSTKWHCST